MERCPTCNAKYAGKRLCHRCKTNLGVLVDIEEKAKEHLEAAKAALASDDIKQMFFHAKRSCSLRRTPEAERLLAYASLLVNQYDRAISSWRNV
ncbi:hypothetical protein QUF72_08920 [Desulfobacterales bacterium HSG2]|nr:hypothetical protein [Desulfobacterales bacterium HSG2]